jgi:hypothetical protein
MYGTIHGQRFRETIDDICETLTETWVIELNLFITNRSGAVASATIIPGLMASADLRSSVIRSSASTPSLRSKDGTLPPHMKMDGGGNVKVVVRVRAFLPRGAPLSNYTLLPPFQAR